MIIALEELRLKGFKSFNEEATIDFASLGDGLHFIRGRNMVDDLGSNGAGKSSLWDAVSWCVWGKTIAGLRNPDVKPWAGGKTAVETIWRVGKKRHAIKRTQGPNLLTLDGKEAPQEEIDALLLPYDLAMQTIILGQGRALFLDLEPRKKLEVLSDVLGLDRWEARSEVASDMVKKYEKTLIDINTEIAGYHYRLDSNSKMLEEISQKQKTWQEENRAQIKEAEKELKSLADIREAAQRNKDDADLAFDSAMTELASLNREVTKLQDDLVEQQRVVAEHRGHIKAAEEERKRIEAALKVSDKCALCGQPLTKKHKEHSRDTLEARLEEVEKRIEAGVPKRVLTAFQTLQDRLANQKGYRDSYRAKADAAREDLLRASRVFEQADARHATLTDRIKRLEEDTNPYVEQARSLKKAIAKDEEDLKDANKDLQHYQRALERTRFWVKAFKDVRLHLLSETMEEIEVEANLLLQDVRMGDWQIRFDIERESKSGTVVRGLNVSILRPGLSAPVKWEVWSGGEGQRLRLISTLALARVLLSRVGIEPGFLILDEPTRHLSKSGVKDVVELLADLAEDRAIFYADHQSVESSRFASVILVTRDQGGSRVDVAV